MLPCCFTKFVHRDLKLSFRALTTGRDPPDNWESLQRELKDRLVARTRKLWRERKRDSYNAVLPFKSVRMKTQMLGL
jgi:hypothetical protein